MPLITPLQGFPHPVYDAQRSFRILLDAMAQPGWPRALPVGLEPPGSMFRTTAAACLTLLDLETRVWLQPGWEASVRSWLGFHTGCRMIEDLDEADFVLIGDPATMLPLSEWNWGSLAEPEHSATGFIQVRTFGEGIPVTLKGPGIPTQRRFAISDLSLQFWREWQDQTQAYPQGLDLFLLTPDQVVGLPRTSKVEIESNQGV